MKTYKELNKMLSEMGPENTEVGGGDARSAMSHFGSHRIEHDEALGRVNAFIHAMTEREFLDPRGALNLMRTKLNTVGLDFEFSSRIPISNGLKEFKVTRFGGGFGKTLDTPYDEFNKTDGISEFNDGKGFNLNINVVRGKSGMYNIDAKIVESKVKEEKFTEETKE
tara:strand:- start:2241 stop:2741 length:501 start_codon:yes stop_codon:yes gene_type:complete